MHFLMMLKPMLSSWAAAGKGREQGEQLAGQALAGSTRLLLNHPSNAPLPSPAGDK